MEEASLILHVGGAKCGSSALQAALSVAKWDASDIGYAALNGHRRRVVYGPAAVRSSLRSAYGYIASSGADLLLKLDRPARLKMFDDLRALVDRKRLVVLSNEGWLGRYQSFADSGFLDDLAMPFIVYVVVRPQVDFMNSAWWQWGAWTGVGLARWVHSKIDSVRWHSQISRWREHPSCRDVRVTVLGRDVVGDFFATFGVEHDPAATEARQVNTSLPGEILRLFQRHPHLRPKPDKAEIDFVLSRIGYRGQPTPWVIDPALAAEIVGAARADNEALLASLPPDQAARMRDNAAWWSADAHAHKPLESPEPQPADDELLDPLCARLVEALVDYDAELRRLRRIAPPSTRLGGK